MCSIFFVNVRLHRLTCDSGNIFSLCFIFIIIKFVRSINFSVDICYLRTTTPNIPNFIFFSFFILLEPSNEQHLLSRIVFTFLPPSFKLHSFFFNHLVSSHRHRKNTKMKQMNNQNKKKNTETKQKTEKLEKMKEINEHWNNNNSKNKRLLITMQSVHVIDVGPVVFSYNQNRYTGLVT